MNGRQPYDLLMRDMPSGVAVERIVRGILWTAAALSDGSVGLAMRTRGETIPRLHRTLIGLPAAQAAQAVLSWNQEEASEAMAVINAWYNDPRRLPRTAERYPYERACTQGLSTAGKTVGIVGHLRLAEDTLTGVKQTYILERSPQAGDYPDPACEFLLPQCDLVIVTASAWVNKTMPRLIALSRQAQVILIGPSTPLHPGLLDMGVTRLCGLSVTHQDAMFEEIARGPCSGYRFGDAYQLG